MPGKAAEKAKKAVPAMKAPPAFDADLMPSEEDLLYEEELLRDPFSLKMWWRYLDARKDATPKRRYLLYERALKSLPGSYKLWHAYLKERKEAVRGLKPTHPAVEALNNTYERALVTMHKMPRIWLEYIDFFIAQKFVTRTRRLFDRCLCSLPVTQHDRIWPLFLDFVRQPGIPVETALRVYRRYLQLEPTHAEEFIEYLKAAGFWNEAAQKLAELVNNDRFTSLLGKTKHQLWLELCDIITKHPGEVKTLNVDAILRGGIRRFTDEVGRLWTSLADYYIRRGMFEKARDVYEEGLTTVVTVRDFSMIFDAYSQFEESMVAAKMEAEGDDEDEEEEVAGDGEDFLLTDTGADLDLRLARMEHLMDRRPELISSVMLRQNPNNVYEWHKRVKLFEGQPTRQILTFTEAVKTVSPEKAMGKLYTLWVAFARFYEAHRDLNNARVIFEKAVQVPYKSVDDLATVWCQWAEMELKHKNFRGSLEIMERATKVPAGRQDLGPDSPVAMRVHKSLKLWSFYCDLQESLGTLEDAKAVYTKILDLRIATPQIILNFALLLQENKYFEESFKVYERGVAIFKYPHVKDIWQAYLTLFVSRFGGKKLERARDLFEQALDQAPPEESKALFMEYAKLEEQHGLARHAMAVYARAVKRVPPEQRLSVYNVFIQRATEFFGVGKVREIYESSIEEGLPDADTKSMCVRYAQLERKLGEVDRARALLTHASQFADPRRDAGFWVEWNEFEVKHGNEETFREMLRIKRSVAASFSQMHFSSGIMESVAAPAGEKRKRGGEDDAAAADRGGDAMASLEAAVAPSSGLGGFVSAGSQLEDSQELVAGGGGAGGGGAARANPEEIDLGDMDEDADDEPPAEGQGPDLAISQKAVPDAVFGSLAGRAMAEEDGGDGGGGGGGGGGEKVGALDRFKKARKG